MAVYGYRCGFVALWCCRGARSLCCCMPVPPPITHTLTSRLPLFAPCALTLFLLRRTLSEMVRHCGERGAAAALIACAGHKSPTVRAFTTLFSCFSLHSLRSFFTALGDDTFFTFSLRFLMAMRVIMLLLLLTMIMMMPFCLLAARQGGKPPG